MAINEKEYIKILMVMAGNFGAELDELTIEFWLEMFNKDGITLEQIRTAAETIIRTRKYKSMPTYAEFVEAIHGPTEGRAQRQVDIVMDALKGGGSSKPFFADPITRHLMTVRWPWHPWASGVLADDLKWWRKEFMQAYQEYSALRDDGLKQIENIHNPGGNSILPVEELVEKIGFSVNEKGG